MPGTHRGVMSLAYLCHGLLQLLNLRIPRKGGEVGGGEGAVEAGEDRDISTLTQKWITRIRKNTFLASFVVPPRKSN